MASIFENLIKGGAIKKYVKGGGLGDTLRDAMKTFTLFAETQKRAQAIIDSQAKANAKPLILKHYRQHN